MVESIDSISDEIRKHQGKLEKAPSDEEKKNLLPYISELNGRLKKAKNDFSIITTGIDYGTFLKKEGKEVDWEKELKEIFSPIVVELKEITERPRKMERLRSEILYYEKRIPQVKKASGDIDRYLEKVTDKKVIARLNIWKEYWSQLEKEFVTQNEAAQYQFIEEEQGRKSILTSFKVFFDSFIKHRGKNLFFAFLAFFVIYLIFRLLQRLIWKFSPIHRSPKYMFWANLVDVMFYVLTFLVATGALVAVLFTSGDWLILAIVMLLVLGIIWGVRNTLPQFVEQIKLLLGFGPVRHGERIIIDGIPWRVEMLGVYSYLKNPLLTSGTKRLPLKDLIGMRSCPYDENDPWFPCREGDCVLINSSWRHVILQTPQIMKFEWYEMEETMLTSSFLSQKIFNLSEPPLFWKGISFYIAYKHRSEIMGEITEKLAAFVEDEIKKEPYGEHLHYPWVAFGEMNDTSLGFWVWLQMKKEAASSYNAIGLALTQICLKAANEYGWDIVRFTHVNLTQPDGVQGLLENKDT